MEAFCLAGALSWQGKGCFLSDYKELHSKGDINGSVRMTTCSVPCFVLLLPSDSSGTGFCWPGGELQLGFFAGGITTRLGVHVRIAFCFDMKDEGASGEVMMGRDGRSVCWTGKFLVGRRESSLLLDA